MKRHQGRQIDIAVLQIPRDTASSSYCPQAGLRGHLVDVARFLLKMRLGETIAGLGTGFTPKSQPPIVLRKAFNRHHGDSAILQQLLLEAVWSVFAQEQIAER